MDEVRSAENTLMRVEDGDVPFLAGPPERRVMDSVEDVRSVVEQCLSQRASAVLLHAPNLTDAFFDLSSGEAGAILQKLFQYRIRLAIVCPPGAVRLSNRFGELLAEEAPRGRVGVFDSADAARGWIEQTRPHR